MQEEKRKSKSPKGGKKSPEKEKDEESRRIWEGGKINKNDLQNLDFSTRRSKKDE